ncbi:hypothetical protein IGB42_01738 [Andreprevotia sp. IGB-42]|uniref:HvfC/BufC N-terminal domain-containing protein n=1 Tax=Andreprevotia sp. IGB-42 TaxID=2497473 RepID=UPI0013583EDD|nr:DNA-binding domain-containing protein [Andreprevotia sp. IGB-42]KAF0814058.1 hypothetical protein IGB42_01738 [Andreprevotia sp. IGB-42]
MLSYAEAIADFALGLADSNHVPGSLTGQTQQHLAIYRNNVRLNRIDALPAAFPTVAALVGEDYFRALAREYVKAVPASSANLHDDGAALAAFIATFAPATALPYLPDVARLDWALHRAYHAADAAPLDTATLAALQPAQFAALQLQFHPAVALVRSSAWPIADILTMHQGGATAMLDAGGQSVLVWRNATGVQHLPVADPAWLAALLGGQSLGDTLAQATQDPNPLLARLFAEGLISAIRDTTP